MTFFINLYEIPDGRRVTGGLFTNRVDAEQYARPIDYLKYVGTFELVQA